MVTAQFQHHTHQEMIHVHEHIHVTHHLRSSSNQVEHLVSKHTHDHNHPALAHDHAPHEDFEQEHQQEAHIHDHEHPTQS